jgi:hypothetical protein
MQSIPGLAAPRTDGPFTNTRTEGREAAVDRDVAEAKLKGLLKLAETHLLSAPGFAHTARVGEADVQLVTDDPHLLEFWRANWFPSGLDAKPDGRICAVTGVEKREPGVFYQPATGSGVLFNTNHYAHLHAVALDIAAASVAEAGGRVLSGIALRIANRGLVLLLGRSRPRLLECALSLADAPDVRLAALSRLAVYPREDDRPAARCLENAFFLPGPLVRRAPELARYLDRAHAEDLVLRFEDCANRECLDQVVAGTFRCVFHAGYRACVWSDPHCGLLLCPGWLNRTSERCSAGPLLALAALSELEEAEPGQAPRLETVPPDVAWHAVLGQAAGAPAPAGDLEWLAGAQNAPAAELKAFIEKLAPALTVLAVRHGPLARFDSPDQFLAALPESETTP